MSESGGELVVDSTQVEETTTHDAAHVVRRSSSTTHVEVKAEVAVVAVVAVEQHVIIQQPGPIHCTSTPVHVVQAPAPVIQQTGPVRCNSNVRVVEPEDQIDCNQCCCTFFKMFGMICYIGCPPVPEFVARKIAFHPPPRGTTYRIRGITKRTKETRDLFSILEHQMMEELWLYSTMPSENKDSAPDAWIREAATTFIVQSKEDLLVGIWVYSPNCVGPKEKKVILFSGGNSADLGIMIQNHALLTMAAAFSADIIAYDYAGYGYSTGTPSEKNIYANVETMYEYVKSKKGDDVQIILLGYSIGTAAAIDLASKRPDNLAGLILVAPFTSGMRMMTKKPDEPKSGWLDRFLSVDKVAQVNVPTLIIHGNRDQTVPIEHSYALYRKLTKPVKPLYMPQCDHDNILGPRQVTVSHRISNFVASEIDGASSTAAGSE